MEWISALDRKPENETRKVIVWIKMFYAPSYIHVGTYIGNKWEYGDTRLGQVTHWMPLPEPPITDNQKMNVLKHNVNNIKAKGTK